LLFEWSRPVSFLLDQNIILTQFILQTLINRIDHIITFIYHIDHIHFPHSPH